MEILQAVFLCVVVIMIVSYLSGIGGATQAKVDELNRRASEDYARRLKEYEHDVANWDNPERPPPPPPPPPIHWEIRY